MNITITSSTVTVIKLRTPSFQQNIFPVISAAHQFKFIVAIIIITHELDYRLQYHQVERYARLDALVGIKKKTFSQCDVMEIFPLFGRNQCPSYVPSKKSANL